jgi:primosomal protein DnaI
MQANCPECGVRMTTGQIYKARVIYDHFKDCAALEARLARESAEALEAQKAALRRQRSNLPASEEDLAAYRKRFRVNAETRQGLTLCEQFVRACGETLPACGFTLHGHQGTGKTTLIIAFARSLLAAGVDVRFERTPELYNRLLQASRSECLEDELRRLRSVKVLVLDDLGREKPTPWWVDQVLFPLIDYRYGQRKPTVVTTNYEWPALEELYGNARNEREQAHSAPQLVDRLQHRSAAVKFGGDQSQRVPEWDFMPQRGAA